MVATVDDEDYGRLSKYSWQYYNGYAYRYYNETMNIYMHREIMGVTNSDIKIDHINRNGLCNERHNLRTCTVQQNCMNRGPKPNSSSVYKGVFRYRDRHGIKWRARIQYNGKNIHLGYYKSEDEAAIAYNVKAYELFGEFAYLNNIKKESDDICQL